MNVRPKNYVLSHCLLQHNDKPLKFYLDGYNAWEFHAVAKIIEAFGGRLTVPDKDTFIFAEPNRPVEKYLYRYNIEYIQDCLAAREQLDIQKYLLPRYNAKAQRPEVFVAPLPPGRKEMKDADQFEGANAIILDECDSNSSYIVESSKRRGHLRMTGQLKNSNVIEPPMPERIPLQEGEIGQFDHTSLSSKPKDDVIFISDDSGAISPRVDFPSSHSPAAHPPTPLHSPIDGAKRRHKELFDSGPGIIKRQREFNRLAIGSSSTNLNIKSNISTATTVNNHRHNTYERGSSIEIQESSAMRCPVARKSTIKNGKLQRKKNIHHGANYME